MPKIALRFIQFGYGPNCRVLGGPEMLREMRATVQKMAEMYAEEG